MNAEDHAQREAERFLAAAAERRVLTQTSRSAQAEQRHGSSAVELREAAWMEAADHHAYFRARKWLERGYRYRDFWWLRIFAKVKDGILLVLVLVAIILGGALLTDLKFVLGLFGRV